MIETKLAVISNNINKYLKIMQQHQQVKQASIYFFCGFSFGGLTAFLAASQLTAFPSREGQKVSTRFLSVVPTVDEIFCLWQIAVRALVELAGPFVVSFGGCRFFSFSLFNVV